MKIFMIFTALMLVFLSAFLFTADLNQYALLENRLKYAAEECACGAALMIDPEAASRGFLFIDEKNAKAYVMDICAKITASSPEFSRGTVEVSDIVFGENYSAVRLTYSQTTDLFRLPFFSMHSFSREAEYKWE